MQSLIELDYYNSPLPFPETTGDVPAIITKNNAKKVTDEMTITGATNIIGTPTISTEITTDAMTDVTTDATTDAMTDATIRIVIDHITATAAAAAAATAAGEAGKQEANNGAGSEVAPASSTENEMKSSAIPAVMCDVCQLPFPSMTVLENHLNGNRHARRVKSKEALKQLLDSGVQFHHEEGVSEMRCEICRMSVNSSHQLQAHLQG